MFCVASLGERKCGCFQWEDASAHIDKQNTHKEEGGERGETLLSSFSLDASMAKCILIWCFQAKCPHSFFGVERSVSFPWSVIWPRASGLRGLPPCLLPGCSLPRSPSSSQTFSLAGCSALLCNAAGEFAAVGSGGSGKVPLPSLLPFQPVQGKGGPGKEMKSRRKRPS